MMGPLTLPFSMFPVGLGLRKTPSFLSDAHQKSRRHGTAYNNSIPSCPPDFLLLLYVAFPFTISTRFIAVQLHHRSQDSLPPSRPIVTCLPLNALAPLLIEILIASMTNPRDREFPFRG